ncbi:PREDICTED: serine/threonine-protein phosphatase 6 regulatory ankyrin repeat subunit B-like isoform X2 [Priapulus caudatus]|uniref:Serine/threonine-protein phosphatase 6 regulatory ankyrin repeat subunit B-like isoform X2 n=1 Tax=Priapulus caudatus TaxID=37621 RepID=A0ABM1FAJ9_PRICU|nr:PREDICTED: serine/threonine-protein phosphatase 6 regulatory ankyrin repeat subunit B-like isoform X2 [Priapulus caudatus]
MPKKKNRKLDAIFNPTGGLTPLMAACQQQNEDTVKMLLQSEYPAAERDKSGKTALHYCSENRNSRCAMLLLDTDPSLIDVQDEEGHSALHLAAICGSLKVLRCLLEYGADVQLSDGEGHTIMHWCAVCGQVKMIDLLIDCGAEASSADIHGAYPLHYAAQMCGSNDMGNDPELGLATLRTFLQREISTNCSDKDGSSDACEMLVNFGADTHATDKEGLAALHITCSLGHQDCAQVLLDKGNADVDSLDHTGKSPLFHAAMHDHPHCVNMLLEHLANPNLRDSDGRSAAHYVASRGILSCLQLLHENKIDLMMQDKNLETPLHYAMQADRIDIVQFLFNANKKTITRDVNRGNMHGRTCLHLAVKNDNLEMCQLLLEKKAFVNPLWRNRRNYITPFDMAIMKGHKEIADFLKSKGGRTGSFVSDKAARIIVNSLRMVIYKLRRKCRDSNMSFCSSPRAPSQISRRSEVFSLQPGSRLSGLLHKALSMQGSAGSGHTELSKTTSLQPPTLDYSSQPSSKQHSPSGKKPPKMYQLDANPVLSLKSPYRGVKMRTPTDVRDRLRAEAGKYTLSETKSPAHSIHAKADSVTNSGRSGVRGADSERPGHAVVERLGSLKKKVMGET